MSAERSRTAGKAARRTTAPPAADKLDAAEVRRTFLAMALTHELKQPLNSLNLNAELLSKRLAKIPGVVVDVAGPLQALGRVVDRVAGCLEAYYGCVQPEAVPSRPIDLRPILEEAAARAAAIARRAGVRVVARVPDGLPRLPAHARQLGVALDALLDNAVLASRPGTEVVLEALADREEVRVSVIDQGVGMAPEVARRAVEIGFSTRGAVGVGMTVAKFIAYHHAGGFQVDTHLGAGTTVSIVLPVAGE